MAKIPEAQHRMYDNIYVCKKCKTKIRAPNIKILHQKVKCRRCQGKDFRAIKKK